MKPTYKSNATHSGASGRLPTPPPTQKRKRGAIVAKTPDGRTVEITFAQWLLAQHLKELGIETNYEYRFWEFRDWRLDLYAPKLRMGFEINGGQFTGGHRTGFWGKKEGARRRRLGLKETPQEEEYTKLNIAAADGIRVLQFTNEQVNDGRAKEFVKEHFAELFQKENK